ncbi:MAG TPA: ATP-binding cassette domain-containing protein [Acidisphaera sp.]|nr:ATP-binding cassette domain-containing protein [Acidisphaera sp.]
MPPQPGTPYLVVERVGKMFGDFVALEDVSLTIDAGEFVSFVGPSGCGKTTLLRAIAGLDPATSGRIIQAGKDITGLPTTQRDFGIVFQSYALFPNMTVEENIGYGLRGPLWPAARRKQRVAELIGLIGLGEHAKKYPAQMSGGQQQRVALARALASEPGLLLLDEPLSALDAIVRLHLRSEIRALQRRLGVTTIMVTHDQEEALSVSDRLVVMSKGRIEQIGTPEEIYRAPRTAFVANFIGRSSAFDAVVQPGGLVDAKGVRLEAASARTMTQGTAVRVLIRPEDVDVAAGVHGPQALVASIEYLGPVCRLSLDLGSLALTADIPSDRVHRDGLAEGSSVPVGIPPERVMVFPADG